MLTIHTADLVVSGAAQWPPLPGGGVLVEGRQIAAVGPYEELASAHPTARVRRWPGLLTPGLLNPYGPELLERAYHPDPREVAELGTEPLMGERLGSLEMTDARWGASARRGVQRMLAHGTVAVAGDLLRPAVLDAVYRVGMTAEERFGDPPGTPTLDPLAGRSLTEAILMPLPPYEGMDATFAVFDVPDEAALAEDGARRCVATVVEGRLLYRRR
ncbi:imidazolonepropionase-like domain-containing protein [Streptomyces sp. NPDC093598]|uniref:imidazolonepropionase-like domain-containing protein n=1 Tax=Streptomyces sp. NPDC093598 TaxID=3366046 RepID=UPI0037FAE3FC